MSTSQTSDIDYYLERYDNVVDITDRVKEFPGGKTFECDCGLGHGVQYGSKIDKCPRCQAVLIDMGEPREYTKPEGQTSLGDW